MQEKNKTTHSSSSHKDVTKSNQLRSDADNNDKEVFDSIFVSSRDSRNESGPWLEKNIVSLAIRTGDLPRLDSVMTAADRSSSQKLH